MDPLLSSISFNQLRTVVRSLLAALRTAEFGLTAGAALAALGVGSNLTLLVFTLVVAWVFAIVGLLASNTGPNSVIGWSLGVLVLYTVYGVLLFGYFHGAKDTYSLLNPNTPGWLKIAYGEIGQEEGSEPEENSHVREYFKSVDNAPHSQDTEDWASAFVNWSFLKAGLKGAKSLDPFAWRTWGHEVKVPTPGTVVIFSFKSNRQPNCAGLRHVGFFMSDEGKKIRVLGGDEDDMVKINRYSKSDILNYRMPSNWAFL